MACFLNDYGCNTSVYHDKITEERHLKCTVKSPTIHADLLLMKVIWHHQKYKKPRLYGVLLELVREWVMKSPKMLFTFADTPRRSWSHVDFYNKIFKPLTWLVKAMTNSSKNRSLIFFFRPKFSIFTHRPPLGGLNNLG